MDGPEVGHPALGRELPLLEDDDGLAERLDVVEDVRGQEDLDRFVDRDVPDELEDLRASGRVEVRGRLVEEEDLRVVDEGLGQLEALLHARGIGVEEPVAGLAEADVEEDLVGPLHGLLPGHAGELAEIRGEGHGVHAGDEAIALGHVADRTADHGLLAPDVVVEDLPLAALRDEEAEEDAEEGALAGPVRPEESHGPFAEAHGHAVQGDDLAVAEAQVLDFDAHPERQFILNGIRGASENVPRFAIIPASPPRKEPP